MIIVVLLGFAFLGYAIGRISHILGGHLNAPHHWIYGILLIVIGTFFYKHSLAQWAIAFGVGHTISDWNDMLAGKFFGPDEPGPKRFWGID